MRIETKKGYVLDAPFVVVDENGIYQTRSSLDIGNWVAVPCEYEFPGEKKIIDPGKHFNWKHDHFSEEDIAKFWGCMYADRKVMRLNKRGDIFFIIGTRSNPIWIEEKLKQIQLPFLKKMNLDGSYTVEISGKRFVSYFWALGLDRMPDLHLYSKEVALAFLTGIGWVTGKSKTERCTKIKVDRAADIVNMQRLLLYLGMPTHRDVLHLRFLNNRGTMRAHEFGLIDYPKIVTRGKDLEDLIPNMNQFLYQAYYMDRDLAVKKTYVKKDYLRFLPPESRELTWSWLEYLTSKYQYAKVFLNEIKKLGYFHDQVTRIHTDTTGLHVM